MYYKSLKIILMVTFYSVVDCQISNKIIIEKVNKLLDDAQKLELFSGQVIMSQNGETFYYSSQGYADWENKTPITKKTSFNICSLNKQFTEEIIHQLVNENKLTYDSKLDQFLDIFPSNLGSKITIQQLLDMEAGFGDYLINPEFIELSKKDYSLTDLINIIKKEPILFEPGTNRIYSNSGYAVLGAIIENVTKNDFKTELMERIFSPLNIENIAYSREEKMNLKDHAKGTIVDLKGKKSNFSELTNSSPAGGIYMTIDDLLKFTEAKMNSSLPSSYLYSKGSYSGGTPVWNSTIYYNKTNGYAFAIMCNMGNISNQLAMRINSILNDRPYPPLNYPFVRILNQLLVDKGSEYIKSNIERLSRQAGRRYSSRFLNFYGYEFLNMNEINQAIELFKLNVDLFPNDVNTYDSLAEAYSRNGNIDLAIKFYKIALSFNPNDSRIIKILNDLEK